MQENKKPMGISRKLAYTISFFLAGILLVTFSFWKMIIVILITAIGFFIGSSDNLGLSVKSLINRLFPPSDKKVTYTSEDLDKLKKALEKKETEKLEAEKNPGASKVQPEKISVEKTQEVKKSAEKAEAETKEAQKKEAKKKETEKIESEANETSKKETAKK